MLANELRLTCDVEGCGAGKFSSNEAKKIGRLKRELCDIKDALEELKKQ